MQPTKPRLRPTLLFVGALVAAPFFYTAIARLIPVYTSFWEYAIGIALSLAVAVFVPKWRPLALGFLAGSILFALFFVWLFLTMGSIG